MGSKKITSKLPTHIKLIENCYDQTISTFRMQAYTNPVPIKRGVRQGDTLSSKLLTNALQDIFRTLKWDQMGININGERLNHLRYADDIVLISDNIKDLKEMIETLNRIK